MLGGRRLSLVARVFPRLFCRSISVSRVVDKAPTSSSTAYLSSSEESSSAGESCLESEDGEAAPQPHQIQVLRAYLRNRRSRCLARVREHGMVPAVVVDPDRERRPKDGSTDIFISLDAKPLVAILKHIGKRDFVSRVFDMDIYRGPSSSELKESLQVLPRNLNYGPGKTNILNIQFVKAPPGENLTLGIPLEFLGIDQCPGLKKGGTLKKLARYVVYTCKVVELPAKIVVDMSVLEIGDRVRVQDLEVNFDHLASDRTMVVCEIVKDVSTLKAKARQLKNEILYKKKALAEKESSMQEHSLSDDEIDVSDDGEDEVIPYRHQKQRALAKKGSSMKKASTKGFDEDPDAETSSRGLKRANSKTSRGIESKTSIKPSRRRLFGTSIVSSREKQLDEQAAHYNASSSVKKHKFDVSESDEESEDDGALPSSARKQGLMRNRGITETSRRRVPRGQQGISSSSRRRRVSDDSEAEDEDDVMPSRSRKRAASKALHSRADSDTEGDDEAYISRAMKASVNRKMSGIRPQKERKGY
ncbi:hypothetical protein GOP47_0020469 [Adiantum capillus-veneris]|uniref:Large ribosomal subunit protein bL25 beta domain-containing protein n=1 Tax=Adiantum capillus-veneris TaxID=13818 RepID=A0A9D4U959_ADICA|nr:hypothetical protein GOP47_0020469 [Adiantum capillus-veneris]